MQPAPKIPGYELLQCLGGGPLCTVWSARDRGTDAACAVKVLRPEWQDRPLAVKLLQREARAGLAVRHRHLVSLLHAHVFRPPHFLVLELLPGESLGRRLRRDFRLDLGSAVWIARQTAEALAALHRAGFLHGDVKPENIRLVKDGTAVLIDLGFAHRPGENRAFLRHGYVLGTADYLAPELCTFKEDSDLKSDLFSLGVMLFEMLTGRLPYPEGSLEKTIRRHRCDPPADLRSRLPELPASLAGLVERLLAHRPADRPGAGSVVQKLIALEIDTLRRRISA